MKALLSLALLLVALAAPAATLPPMLVWDPSDSTQGPPAVSYNVYVSIVVNPTNAVWLFYGSSTTTNLVITNNLFRMFQVKGVNAEGVEGGPSNVATNQFAPPAPPGRSRVTASIEGASSINGPWLELTNVSLVVSMEIPPQNQFFRTRTQIATLENP